MAIAVVVFGHVGGFWAFRPYTEFLHVVVPVFFFLSGAVCYFSFLRSKSTVDYMAKRLLGLLVPYYLLCVLCLSVYAVMDGEPAAVTPRIVLDWLTIQPTTSLMGFPIGQVWFLHTLSIILIASPIYFTCYRSMPWLLVAIAVAALLLASLQLRNDVHSLFTVGGHDLFKPIVHSLFFITGFVWINSIRFRSKPLLVTLGLTSGVLCAGLAASGLVDVDLATHTYSPDLYYVAASFAALCGVLLLQNQLLALSARVGLITQSLDFLHRHTLAIYLLHTFSIYLVEQWFHLTGPQQHPVTYGIVKFALVMGLTCVMAIPFSRISAWLANRAIALAPTRRYGTASVT